MTPVYKFLLTGANGLLGHYLKPILQQIDHTELTTLGRSAANDIVCDLEQEMPHFIDKYFTAVIHAAGTEQEQNALSLNLEGTRRLLQALADKDIKYFVYISSVEVYGKQDGLGIDEQEHLWAANKVGQSKALAEEEIRKFCDEKGIILTILRPVTMFGKDMRGWGQRMASQVLAGTYLNIRQADATVSLVTALDVARIIPKLYTKGGVYNVTDGKAHSLRDLAMAMGNNRGAAKKPFWLPLKWAQLLARLGDAVPFMRFLLDSDELKRRMTSITYSNRRLCSALPDFVFYDTAAVTGRVEKDFPYEDD